MGRSMVTALHKGADEASFMSGLLAEMGQSSLARLEQARARESERELWGRASDAAPAPRLKLCAEGFDVIAECKLHSPSAGDLSGHTSNVIERVQSYAQGGACAVSVLTDRRASAVSCGTWSKPRRRSWA
ncbi:MAG: hypothetical protein HC872_05395 [Gammaproteobacteria bacterium]|nr:hypothetical protein [Gammaproteobacteria bacterium]